MFEKTSIVTGVLDISTDSGCSTATDPDMALNRISDRDVTMTLSSSTGHSDWMHPGPWTPTWTQMTDLTLGVPMVLLHNRSRIRQSRPWPLEGHRPGHGPWQ